MATVDAKKIRRVLIYVALSLAVFYSLNFLVNAVTYQFLYDKHTLTEQTIVSDERFGGYMALDSATYWCSQTGYGNPYAIYGGYPSEVFSCGVWGFFHPLNFWLPIQLISTPLALLVAVVSLPLWSRVGTAMSLIIVGLCVSLLIGAMAYVRSPSPLSFLMSILAFMAFVQLTYTVVRK